MIFVSDDLNTASPPFSLRSSSILDLHCVSLLIFMRLTYRIFFFFRFKWRQRSRRTYGASLTTTNKDRTLDNSRSRFKSCTIRAFLEDAGGSRCYYVMEQNDVDDDCCRLKLSRKKKDEATMRLYREMLIIQGGFEVAKESKNCKEIPEDDEAILIIIRFQRELEVVMEFCLAFYYSLLLEVCWNLLVGYRNPVRGWLEVVRVWNSMVRGLKAKFDRVKIWGERQQLLRASTRSFKDRSNNKA
ncbi:unnamed protein product [Vicia faba]|uniref:Uncharacterized protein n=1 Tax=Vicia faba TaxID=3906 RepID=A0AAV1AZH7_VICFA|nr:unnamed protein product [Vicia faba]